MRPGLAQDIAPSASMTPPCYLLMKSAPHLSIVHSSLGAATSHLKIGAANVVPQVVVYKAPVSRGGREKRKLSLSSADGLAVF